MNKNARLTGGLVGSHLLRELGNAAKQLNRSRGRNRIAATIRYARVLNAFTGQVLGQLGSKAR